MGSSKRVIDLRSGAPRGQQPLFTPRAPRETPSRPLPLRARRRRKRVLIALAVLVFAGAMVWGVSFISYLPRFSIFSITVSGAKEISPQLIADYAQTILHDGSYHFLSRSNIFFYPRTQIENAIVVDFPRIKSAHVSRNALLSTEMKIKVQEREAYALWCHSAQCYTMDEGGFMFALEEAGASSTPFTHYVFEGGIAESSEPIGQTFIKAHLPGLLTLLKVLGQAGFTPQGAVVESDQDFSVPLGEGFILKASFGEDADALTKNLQLVLSSDVLMGKEKEIEYVDLRFGNRVYYKLKGEAQVSAE